MVALKDKKIPVSSGRQVVVCTFLLFILLNVVYVYFLT